MILPELVKKAREFYGCETLPGVPLENDGGRGTAGAHWEKLYLPNEYMNPTVVPRAVFSPITAAFLNATGWYLVSPLAEENYFWGKGDGCSHFLLCPKGSEYCKKEEIGVEGCSPDFISKGSCVTDFFMNQSQCGIFQAKGDGICTKSPADGTSISAPFEIFGPGSRCFSLENKIEKKRENACLIPECTPDRKLVVRTGYFSFICEKSGIEIHISEKFKIICPDIKDFCEKLKMACSKDCYHNGICRSDKTCHCYSDLPSANKVFFSFKLEKLWRRKFSSFRRIFIFYLA